MPETKVWLSDLFACVGEEILYNCSGGGGGGAGNTNAWQRNVYALYLTYKTLVSRDDRYVDDEKRTIPLILLLLMPNTSSWDRYRAEKHLLPKFTQNRVAI